MIQIKDWSKSETFESFHSKRFVWNPKESRRTFSYIVLQDATACVSITLLEISEVVKEDEKWGDDAMRKFWLSLF